MAIGQDEAHALATALAGLQKAYPTTRLLSEKQMAWAALGIVCARVYGVRGAMLAGIIPRPVNVTPARAPDPPVASAQPAEGATAAWFSFPPAGHVQ